MEQLLGVVAASAAVAAVVLLPGFGLTWLASLRPRRGSVPPADRPPERRDAALAAQARTGAAESLVLAIAWSAVVMAAVGGALLALGWFSSGTMAVVALIASASGVVPFLRWCGSLRTRVWAVLVAAALTIPWASLATRGGYPPAGGFQWYYWNLGRELDSVGAAPAWVLEFGERVRWLPDYVMFNVASEAYRGLTLGMDEAAAMAYWRVPVAFLGVAMTCLVLRLWLPRAAATVGAAAVAGTTFFITKFSTYKPEALAIVLGLAGVWLLVTALREERPRWILLAGALSGIGLGVHAIAATVTAMLMVAAAGVEWWSLPRDRRSVMAAALACGVVAALGVAVATGVTLQDRALVAADAANPRAAAGADPTYTFFRRVAGDFGPGEPRRLKSRLVSAVDPVWPGTRIAAMPWILIPPALALGLLLTIALARADLRRGGLTIAAFGALLLAGIAFFALAFDTYVPQYTGIARFGQYLPLVAGLAVGAVLAAWLAALSRRWRGYARWRFDAIVATASVLFAVALVLTQVSGSRAADEELAGLDRGLGDAGREALATIEARAGGDEAVLSNATTRGSVEFLGRRESPLEGRQPFIEEPAFLEAANAVLLEAHQFLEGATGTELLRRLGVRWVLIADDPTELGAQGSYGGSIRQFQARSDLIEAWRRGDVTLFRTAAAPQPLERIGPARTTRARLALSTAGLAALFLGFSLLLERLRHHGTQRAESAHRDPIARGH